MLENRSPYTGMLHMDRRTFLRSGALAGVAVAVAANAPTSARAAAADGPRDMRFVGEVEFVNGVAAQSASGNYGPMRVASGIVGRVDFTTGDAVKPVLEALIRAGDGRLKGTRYNAFFTDIPVWGME